LASQQLAGVGDFILGDFTDALTGSRKFDASKRKI
jgi:hypothetical protein